MVATRIAANIAKLLPPSPDGSANSRANKNRLYVQTDIRRLRRTTRFEHNLSCTSILRDFLNYDNQPFVASFAVLIVAFAVLPNQRPISP